MIGVFHRRPLSFLDGIVQQPPLLIFHGIADTFVPVEQSDRFYAVLKEANVDATLLRFEGEGHAVLKKDNQTRCLPAIVEFLTRHLRRQSGARQ